MRLSHRPGLRITSLTLWRKLPLATDYARAQTITLSPPQQTQMAAAGLELLDPKARPDGLLYHYQLRSQDPNGQPLVSHEVTLQTGMPYASLKQVRARAVLPHTILLQWMPPPEGPPLGALLFRRGIDPPSPFTRVAKVADASQGAYLDRDVEQGGIYVYRVIPYSLWEGIPRFGQLGQEVYASSPPPAPPPTESLAIPP